MNIKNKNFFIGETICIDFTKLFKTKLICNMILNKCLSKFAQKYLKNYSKNDYLFKKPENEGE